MCFSPCLCNVFFFLLLFFRCSMFCFVLIGVRCQIIHWTYRANWMHLCITMFYCCQVVYLFSIFHEINTKKEEEETIAIRIITRSLEYMSTGNGIHFNCSLSNTYFVDMESLFVCVVHFEWIYIELLIALYFIYIQFYILHIHWVQHCCCSISFLCVAIFNYSAI